MKQWKETSRPGRLYSVLDENTIQCHLSPRNCKIRDGQFGFCGVRANKGGVLHTLNYGKSVHVTEETIETEAVFHYMPGARILSMGNIGCMMNCDYCHNWKTSQARFVEDRDIREYSSQELVEIAVERKIPVLSWTYNDPVVWHEFVLDTGRLARTRGLKNLFKSAFFISLEGAAELCEVIDIFSVSIKTMNEKLYRKISKGWLPPVLEATKYVFAQDKHVEISNLMVTDANDSEDDARAIAEWVLTNLSDEVPVHFVRFHPDYKYTHVGRTPIERLVRAREAAMEMGIKYCYLGNVYGQTGTTTFCPNCGEILIERFGLNTRLVGLDVYGACVRCAHTLNILLPPENVVDEIDIAEIQQSSLRERRCEWHGDVNACHVEVINFGKEKTSIYYWREEGEQISSPRVTHVDPQDSYRFIVSKSSPQETGIRIQYPEDVQVKVYEVFDRAHYPTLDVDQGRSESDSIPLPLYIPMKR